MKEVITVINDKKTLNYKSYTITQSPKRVTNLMKIPIMQKIANNKHSKRNTKYF